MHKPCIACGFHVSYPVYQPGELMLTALGLPKDRESAVNCKKYRAEYRACGYCGHIYNPFFDYALIPYVGDSNRMFNSGTLWQDHMKMLADKLNELTGNSKVNVIEIGSGPAEFMDLLKERAPVANYIVFEPGLDAEIAAQKGHTAIMDYFRPDRDIGKHKPDVIVMRHVLEHLEDPRAFINEISYYSNLAGIRPIMMVEVPRIDKAVQETRVNDFIYEHVSNFTTYSLENMFSICGFDILWSEACYGGEVAVIAGRPKAMTMIQRIKNSSEKYYQGILKQKNSIRGMLDTLQKQGKSFAFWGGTGKSCAFLNAFDINCEEFPVVVDSDYNKAGTFVPGMGQELRTPDYLKTHPVDIIVITTQWRAKDIFNEITQRELTYEDVLVLHDDTLISYRGEAL